MEQEEKYLGYMKYKGKLVDEGFMDARKSAQALLGFDEAVRFYIFQQAPELRKSDFELPVRVKKGSWEIVIPDLIDLVKISGGTVVTAYGVKAAQIMAERDFENFGFKDVLKKSLLAIQWVIRIGKHLGDLTIKKFERVIFKDDNQLIGIRNSEGEVLYVPKQFLEFYILSSTKLLSGVSELVDLERVLSIGVYNNGELIEESITKKHKGIFTQIDSEPEDLLFPELKHGQNIILEGEVTRGNEMSNTLGFGYKGHVITCLPESGSIVRFKPSLFLKSRVHGSISRLDEHGKRDSKRPKIIVSKIEPIENEDEQKDFFGLNN